MNIVTKVCIIKSKIIQSIYSRIQFAIAFCTYISNGIGDKPWTCSSSNIKETQAIEIYYFSWQIRAPNSWSDRPFLNKDSSNSLGLLMVHQTGRHHELTLLYKHLTIATIQENTLSLLLAYPMKLIICIFFFWKRIFYWLIYYLSLLNKF